MGCTFEKRPQRIVHLKDGSLDEHFSPVGGKHAIPIWIGNHSGHPQGLHFYPPPPLTQEFIEESVTKKLSDIPNNKWLVILRDPRDTLVSTCYHQNSNGENCISDT